MNVTADELNGLTLAQQVAAVDPGDWVKARFVGTSPRGYFVEGEAWRSPQGPLMVGKAHMLSFGAGDVANDLSEIVALTKKPQPYAEGTARTEPLCGDVVVNATVGEAGPAWMYLSIPGDEDYPWRLYDMKEGCLQRPRAGDSVLRFRRTQVADRLRLVRELCQVGGDS